MFKLYPPLKEMFVTQKYGRVTKLEFWREGLMAKFTGVIATISVLWVLIKEFIINK